MKRRFVVNPLGEAYHGDECLLSGVNVTVVAQRVLKHHEYMRWLDITSRKGKLNQRVNKAIDQEFRTLARQNMTPNQLEVYNHVTRLQTINDGQFRVYGGIKPNGQKWIVLVTEFLGFVDENEFWADLEALAKKCEAKITTMYEQPHLEKYAPPKGVDGETVLDETTPVTVKRRNNWVSHPTRVHHWATGPNHGRIERQIEMIWDVTLLTLPELRRLRQRMENLTQEMFNKKGVGVI